MLFGYVLGLVSISIFIFLVIFGFINGILVRPYRMKKLAKQLGLSYKSRDKWFAFFKYKKNIISGKYNNRSIEIYDYYLAAGDISERRTVIEIGGEKVNIYRGFAFKSVPIIPVRTIKKILEEYFSNDGVRTRGKIKKEVYIVLLALVVIFFIFIWYYLQSLVV